VVSGFLGSKHEYLLCNSIAVMNNDTLRGNFITQEDIIELLDNKFGGVLGNQLNNVNTYAIENEIKKLGIVKDCNAYVTINGALNITISERQPVVRIINSEGHSYYLDSEGTIIPLSERVSPHVLVVNGYINEGFDPLRFRNVRTKEDSGAIMTDILHLVNYIHQHELWRSQFVQVYVNKKHEFELVPRVGAHIIELGSAEDFKKKLKKLEALYYQGLNKEGWNQYIHINLKYKNQIVCTKI
jgi:cell division protein FtsQ